MNNINSNFSDLANEVAEAGGLRAYRMDRLRDAYEAGRLGPHVVNGISAKLAQNGLGHLPAELPQYQEGEVRLYVRGSMVGRIIDAVRQPTPDGDGLILDVACTDAREALQKVRELVCDTEA